jgi:excisionase family DNA binding protein
MATDMTALVERAIQARQHLEDRGLSEEAQVIEQLVREVMATHPPEDRPFFTVAEAARLVGVTGQTIKNWVARGILTGYRIGARVAIPRAELDGYRALADAAKAMEPLPDRAPLVEEIRRGRRPVTWPERAASGGAVEPEA